MSESSSVASPAASTALVAIAHQGCPTMSRPTSTKAGAPATPMVRAAMRRGRSRRPPRSPRPDAEDARGTAFADATAGAPGLQIQAAQLPPPGWYAGLSGAALRGLRARRPGSTAACTSRARAGFAPAAAALASVFVRRAGAAARRRRPRDRSRSTARPRRRAISARGTPARRHTGPRCKRRRPPAHGRAREELAAPPRARPRATRARPPSRARALSRALVDPSGRALEPLLRAPMREGARWSYALGEGAAAASCEVAVGGLASRHVGGITLEGCVRLERRCGPPRRPPSAGGTSSSRRAARHE